MARNRLNKLGRKSRLCIDDLSCDWDHSSAFEKSDNYMMQYDIKDSNDLVVEEECNLLMPKYIAHHIRSAAIFVLYFGLIGFAITIIGELLRAGIFSSMNYPFSGLIISTGSGELVGDVPTDAPWWWYFLALSGPMIIVEGTVLLALLLTSGAEPKAAFLDGTRSVTIELNTMKKAAGWFCAIKVMAMTLFFPLTSVLYKFILNIERSSDLVIAWRSAVYISSSTEVLALQLLIILAYAYLLSLSGLYIYSMSKTSAVT